MGKYRMQLFYNGSDQYSSIFGGLVTIVCFTTLIIYSTVIFASIFRKEIYNVDKNFFLLSSLSHQDTQPESLQLIYKNKTVHCDECRIFKIRDAMHLMFAKSVYSVVFDSKDFTCGQLRARLDLSLQSGQVLQL
jgi:hypothetical protein